MILPPDAEVFLHFLGPQLTHSTLIRFRQVLAAAILTTGRRTIANL